MNAAEKQLLKACEKGDLDMVKKRIRLKTNINNIYNNYHQSPLTIAIKGAIDAALYNQSVKRTVTAHLDIVKLLIASGADVNDTHAKPLRNTLLWGYVHAPTSLEITKLLVEHGADVNDVDSLGQTPIYQASQLDAIKYLVEKGAAINVPTADPLIVYKLDVDIYGRTCGVDVIRWLIPRANNEWLKWPVLDYVADDLPKTKLLVENGADVNNTEVETYAQSLPVVKYLVSKGADIRKKTKDGKTAVYYASLHDGRPGMFKYLIKKGVSMQPAGEILHELILYETDLEVIKVLVENGIDTHAKYNSETPLEIAIRYKNKQVIAYLTKLESASKAAARVAPLAEHVPLDIAALIARKTLQSNVAEFDKLVNEPSGKKKPCPPGKIQNPATRRCVDANGKIGRALAKY